MDYRNSMVLWDPAPFSRRIKIVPYPRGHHASDSEFLSSCGGCYIDTQKLNGERLKLRILLDFHHIVVGDGLDPAVVHQAFLAFKYYRGMMAPDIETRLHGGAQK